jgi:hypothetical protein
MFRARYRLMSLVVWVTMAALITSSASAAISFEWKVAGKKLGTGESRAFEFNNDGKTGELKGTAGGSSTQILFTALTIHNGRVLVFPPGLDGTVLFLNLVIHRPTNCSVTGNAIKSVPLKAEIVEGASEGKGDGEVDLVFASASAPTNTTLATFEFAGASCVLKGVTPSITGSLLALPLPQKTEVLRQDLDFEAATKEYRTSGNEFKKAGVVFANSTATLSGLTLMVLTSDEVFGPF